MKHVLYVSQSMIPAEREGFRAAIIDIMAEAQINNSSASITGVLAYDRGRFVQYIEGPPDRIDALIDRLRRDDRHTGFTVRSEGPVETRRFPDWSMALLNVTALPEPGFPLAELAERSPKDLVEQLTRAAREDAILTVPTTGAYAPD